MGEFIQEERKKSGGYKSLEDFLERCQTIVNKKSLEGLIKSGALDAFADRGTLVANVEMILERSKRSKSMSGGLFDIIETDVTNKIMLVAQPKATLMEKLMMEYAAFKCFVSAHPLDGLYFYLKNFSFISQFKNTENV
ncbi:hypothetical protein KKG31_03530 [Patescibacteria group bacterium]|nr:hypothetical protein [Patescibacteria group bacterium]MBU1758218.1 hypothetical protein [Patescibacteria group bacterium]